MQLAFSKAAGRRMKPARRVINMIGGFGLLASVSVLPGQAAGEMQISGMTMFRENASSTCVPFGENHNTRENYVQFEANMFKSALYESRTFRAVAEQAEQAGLIFSYICHDGSQFRPVTLDPDHATITVNLLREQANRAHEAQLATQYLIRMKAAELQGVGRNTEFTPQAQLRAYMVQYADAVAWTGLAAVENVLERGGSLGPEFAMYEKIFPGPAAAVRAVMSDMPQDGEDHYEAMKQEILSAGFSAGMADDASRSWVAGNGLPRWLETALQENPDLVATAGTRGFHDTDLDVYGDYLADLDPSGMYDTLYGALDDDPAAAGMARMQAIIDAARGRTQEKTARPEKRQGITPK